jgi:L-lactate dehydrogenase complex protein LldE
MNAGPRSQVGLFVTCLVDLYRPVVGFAAIALIERSGPYLVQVPDAQTCCGQPGYNSGDKESALRIARQVVAAFEGFDYVVAPSGSCAGMIKTHYPELLAGDAAFAKRAQVLADKTYELTQFLRDVAHWDGVTAELAGTATYHDSCSSLRELQVKTQPRELLAKVGKLAFKELPDTEPCCGFGGTFCVKFPDISNRMVEAKVDNIEATGANVVLSADMGCLLNIAGKLKRKGSKVEARHVAEVLAGMVQDPAIGEGQ